MSEPTLFEMEDRYFERFNEHFPNMILSGKKEREKIQECLKTGKPFVPNLTSRIY